jgi:hypothetical protein
MRTCVGSRSMDPRHKAWGKVKVEAGVISQPAVPKAFAKLLG